MSRERVLVVDDERDILELIRYNLVKEGYGVTVARSGEEALLKARSTPPDLIVLDLMLPGLDGLEVCRQLKADARTRSIPIVMLTARDDAADIVAGLELGAADYLTKPISPRILLAHIRAVLRRAEDAQSGSAIRVKALSIHPGRHEVLLEGRRLALTATEFRILLSLAKRPGWVFTRQQLLNAAQNGGNLETERYISERAIDVHIVSLRRKLARAGSYIETIRGVGYRLQDE